eukprot:TRINITY_DN2097_c0_g1_i2.p1 TRINITY_DN2097_c0_g1~~TRINITY_DN2097_c0_g1_i2.p1  ORF type:complete len:341 (-),score=60.91 TRINITY_DN2097_c0_g1_i2:13-1035(-)
MTDVQGGNDNEVANPPEDTVSSISWSPQANIIAVGSWDCKIRLYEVSATGVAAKMMFTDEAPILDVAWKNDGSAVFGCAGNNKVKMWNLQTQQGQVVAACDKPIMAIAYVAEVNMLMTASLDGKLSYWNCTQSTPSATLQLPNKCIAMDVKHPMACVATADNQIHYINLEKPTEIAKTCPSGVQSQVKSLSVFKDRDGAVLGGYEGRVVISYMNDPLPNQTGTKKGFTYKAHRTGTGNSGIAYPINKVIVHPTFGTFATFGGDGKASGWCKDSRDKLVSYMASQNSYTAAAFSKDGQFLCYSSGYDWSEGHAQKTRNITKLHVHQCKEAEVRNRPEKRKK